MTELKLEFSGMFQKPPALYIQTLAILNIKCSMCLEWYYKRCEKIPLAVFHEKQKTWL